VDEALPKKFGVVSCFFEGVGKTERKCWRSYLLLRSESKFPRYSKMMDRIRVSKTPPKLMFGGEPHEFFEYFKTHPKVQEALEAL